MGLIPNRNAGEMAMWKDWVEQIQDHGVNLTDWEDDFVGSVGAQLERGRPLTERQAEILERIYAERTP